MPFAKQTECTSILFPAKLTELLIMKSQKPRAGINPRRYIVHTTPFQVRKQKSNAGKACSRPQSKLVARPALSPNLSVSSSLTTALFQYFISRVNPTLDIIILLKWNKRYNFYIVELFLFEA